MGKREVEQGPTADRVRINVRRARKARDWTLADLADALREVGRPIVTSGVGKIEQGDRRVDVDDLVALALALGVTPNNLLFGHEREQESVQLTANRAMTSPDLLNWANDTPEFVSDMLLTERRINRALASEVMRLSATDGPVGSILIETNSDGEPKVTLMPTGATNEGDQR